MPILIFVCTCCTDGEGPEPKAASEAATIDAAATAADSAPAAAAQEPVPEIASVSAQGKQPDVLPRRVNPHD